MKIQLEAIDVDAIRGYMTEFDMFTDDPIKDAVKLDTVCRKVRAALDQHQVIYDEVKYIAESEEI
jgi:hypothetical protein